jgi:acetate kinase
MISLPDEHEILGGEVQRIASKTSEPSRIVHQENGKEEIIIKNITTYEEAFSEVMKIIENKGSIFPDVFAHRLVHGGTEFTEDTIINADDFESLDKLRNLAPIHNLPVIQLIKECNRKYSNTLQVIVLDTAFHSTIPDYAYTYPLPKKLREELGIRKYGFHGISHQFVSEEAAKYLNIPFENFNAISCHLGSGGASLCAIVAGKSVDNTMGFSPLQGLVMSTRCGDLDPSIILKMIAYSAGDFSKVNDILNKKSGVLGLSGLSSDIRDIILKTETSNDKRYKTTLELYFRRIKKYLGAYLTLVGSTGKLDAIIFTDTIGELIPQVRKSVSENLEFFGVKLNEMKNNSVAEYPTDISEDGSKVRILVIKTNEESAIAKRSYLLMCRQRRIEK